ncbi:MAG: SIS domain-containing protein [Bacilli bacterium]
MNILDIQSEMFDYINHISKNITENISNYESLISPILMELKEVEVKRIIIIASGSSFNASMAAKPFMQKVLKYEVKVVTPFYFQKYDNMILEKDIVLVISQSGRSSNIISVLKTIQHDYVYMLTSNVDSVACKYCTRVFDLGIYEEKVEFVTKGYTLTVLYLMLLGLLLGYENNKISSKEFDTYYLLLEKCSKNTEINIQNMLEFYYEHETELLKIKRFQIIGAGGNYGTALEGALKIAEVIGIPANGYDLEEFLHGPYLETKQDVAVFIINGKGFDGSRAKEIYDSLEVLTNHRYLINDVDETEELISPLSLVVSFQILTNCLMKSKGIEGQSIESFEFERRIKSKI